MSRDQEMDWETKRKRNGREKKEKEKRLDCRLKQAWKGNNVEVGRNFSDRKKEMKREKEMEGEEDREKERRRWGEYEQVECDGKVLKPVSSWMD